MVGLSLLLPAASMMSPWVVGLVHLYAVNAATAANPSSLAPTIPVANLTTDVQGAARRAVAFGSPAAAPRLLVESTIGQINLGRSAATTSANEPKLLAVRDTQPGGEGEQEDPGREESMSQPPKEQEGGTTETGDYMSQPPEGQDGGGGDYMSQGNASDSSDAMSMPPPPGVNKPLPVYWNSEENRWMPTPVFQGVAIFGKGKEIRQCNKHKSEWESLVGLGPAWIDEGVRSMNCNRMLRIVNMGSRRGPNLRVGAEVRFIVGGTCTDCMYNTMSLSMGAFRELTGGALDPPGQIDVAWEFADTE